MGFATVRCVANCTCEEKEVDGLHKERNSQTFLAVFSVRTIVNTRKEGKRMCGKNEED